MTLAGARMDKQKLLERLNEALVKIEVDIKLIVGSILDNTTDQKIVKTLKKLQDGNANQTKELQKLTKYVLGEVDKNEF